MCFELNVSPTAKVIWHKVSSNRLEKLEIEPVTSGLQGEWVYPFHHSGSYMCVCLYTNTCNIIQSTAVLYIEDLT